jgi:hypothetical protein
MEKIFIAIDTPLQNRHLSNLQALATALKTSNEIISEYIGGNLDSEMASSIVEKGYSHFISEVVKNEELKLKASKLANLIITNMCNDLSQTLTEAFNDAFAPLYAISSKDYLSFIGFHKNGNPFIVDSAVMEITEISSIYADTPEKKAFRNKHLEAGKVLNELNVKHQKAFGRAINGLNPLTTLFEVSLDNSIIVKELNYRF